jgi:hypothetical protein
MECMTAWALLLSVILGGGDMASHHWLKDRKNFHHRGTEAQRSEHKWGHFNSGIY